MNLFSKDLLAFSKSIFRNWVFRSAIILDTIALITQIFFPQLKVPAFVYLTVVLAGFFWAGFQVYRDLIQKLPTRPIEPPPFEILPKSFEIYLSQNIPNITIWLYLTNYQRLDVEIRSLEITSFNMSGGPSIDCIQHSGDVKIPKTSTKMVMCKRTLNDSEVRSIRRSQSHEHANASFHGFVIAKIGRKRGSREIAQMSANGRITGLNSN